MNKAFGAFDDKMTSSGISARNPAFAQELKKARDRFSDLTRSIAVETGVEESEEPSSGTTSAQSYRPPDVQFAGTNPGLTVPQIPQQSPSQFPPDRPDFPAPFDLSQMPFYDYETQIPADTISPMQSPFDEPQQNTFVEHFEDPDPPDWEPGKSMRQYRVDVPEICPALIEAMDQASHAAGQEFVDWKNMESLESRKRFLRRLASGTDSKQDRNVVDVLRRMMVPTEQSDHWQGEKKNPTVDDGTAVGSDQPRGSCLSSAALVPRIDTAYESSNSGSIPDNRNEGVFPGGLHSASSSSSSSSSAQSRASYRQSFENGRINMSEGCYNRFSESPDLRHRRLISDSSSATAFSSDPVDCGDRDRRDSIPWNDRGSSSSSPSQPRSVNSDRRDSDYESHARPTFCAYREPFTMI